MQDRFDSKISPIRAYLKGLSFPLCHWNKIQFITRFSFIPLVLYKKLREGSNPLVVDYGYCPPVSLVGGSASPPAGGSSTVLAGGSASPPAGGSSTVIVNDSCVMCRWPLSNIVPMAVHVTTVTPIGNVPPDSGSQLTGTV